LLRCSHCLYPNPEAQFELGAFIIMGIALLIQWLWRKKKGAP